LRTDVYAASRVGFDCGESRTRTVHTRSCWKEKERAIHRLSRAGSREGNRGPLSKPDSARRRLACGYRTSRSLALRNDGRESGKSATRCRGSARTRGEGSKETASGNETESCPGLLRCLQGDQENCAAVAVGASACGLRSKRHASRRRRTTRGRCSHQSRSECQAA